MSLPGPGDRVVPPAMDPCHELDIASGSLSAVGKVMVILDCFRDTNRHLRLSDITRRTGLSRSTVHRVLQELCEWNALERTPNGYRVGVRTFGIGSAVQTQDRVYEAAIPVMQEVFDATGDNVHVSMLDGAEVVFVLKLTGQRSYPVITRPGGRLPALLTASGKAILAHSPNAAVDAVLSDPVTTETTRVDDEDFKRQLDKVRIQGYVCSVGEFRADTASVAAPIFAWDGEILAALSVVGDCHVFDPERFAPRVRSAALSLTRRILQLSTHRNLPR